MDVEPRHGWTLNQVKDGRGVVERSQGSTLSQVRTTSNQVKDGRKTKSRMVMEPHQGWMWNKVKDGHETKSRMDVESSEGQMLTEVQGRN